MLELPIFVSSCQWRFPKCDALQIRIKSVGFRKVEARTMAVKPKRMNLARASVLLIKGGNMYRCLIYECFICYSHVV
jgi:hypothetical protein